MDESKPRLKQLINAWEYRWGLVERKSTRIKAIIAQEQLMAATREPKSGGRGRRERKLSYWADIVATCEV